MVLEKSSTSKNKSENTKKTKGKANKTATLLLVVFLILYIPSLWNWVYGTNISTDIIREGIIEISINAESYIVRDEEVLKSQFEGKYIPEVAEGERVPANFRVATILKKTAVRILEELEDKNRSILKTQNEEKDALNIFSEDAQKIDDKIKVKINMLIDEVNQNTLATSKQFKSQIDELAEKKIAIMGGNNVNNAFLNQLKKERDGLQEQVNLNTRDVISETPGIISYTIDNYESVLTPKAIDKLTPKFLETIKITTPTDIKNNDVNAEKAFARIIKGNEYYIVVVLDSDKAESFNKGDKLSIRINEIGKKLDECYISYKSEEIDKKNIIAIKIDRYMNETSHLRKINIDLIQNFHQGLKVPLKSLKYVDEESGKARIVMVESNYAITREVVITGKNNEFAIINNPEDSPKKHLSLYDTYIINPENIEEGQIIN